MPGPKPLLHTILICLFLIHGLPGVQYGQEKRYANGLYFERFSLREGLPSQSTHCVVVGQAGEIWLGSGFGVVRYDGYSFKLYPYSAPLPFSSGAVRHLCEDPGGNLWFSMNGHPGIFRFCPEEGDYQPFPMPPGESGRVGEGEVTALAAAVDHALWIGTASDGLYRLRLLKDTETGGQKAIWQHFPAKSESGQHTPAGPLSNRVNQLLFYPNGDLWIATDKGVSRMKPKQDSEQGFVFDHFQKTAADVRRRIRAEAVTALALSPSGGIWLGGRAAGAGGGPANTLECYTPASGTFQSLPDGISGKAPVSCLLESLNGHLYVGTLGAGLYAVRHAGEALKGRPTEVRNHQFEPPAAWENAHVLQILQGPFENIWIATKLTGLYKLNPYFNQFAHYQPPPAPGDDNIYVTSAVEGPGGKVWLGTSSSGVYCYDRHKNTFTQYLPEAGNPFSLASRTALFVFIDRSSNVWIPTTAGSNRYEPETGRLIRFPEPRGYVVCMYEDSLGYRWFGSIGGGLTIMGPAGQAVARYRHQADDPYSLSSNEVWQVYKDSRGDIYIPTAQGLNRVIRNGPLRVDSLLFERIETPNPLVSWIHEDRAGRYWLSYLGYGFCRWNPLDNSCQEYALPADMANVILEDGRGRLWLIASAGIFCFDPETETLQSYDNSYGIPFASLGRFGRLNAAGEITLSAGSLGCTIFHPDSIRSNPTAPKVKITDVYTLADRGKDSSLVAHIKTGDRLSLPFSRNSVAIEYMGMHYSQPEKNRYAYRMQGLDAGWIDAGQSRVARYSKLPPGQYAFQVKAASANGVWSEKVAEVPIHIAPPWWRSGWAYSVYVLLLLSAIAWYNRFQRKRWKLEANLALEQQRAAQLEQMDEFKSRFFTNITHEFRTPLTIILGMADQIRLQPHKLLDEGLRMITRNGKALLHLVNQMLDLARAESGTLKVRYIQADILPFLKYLAESFHSYAESRRIALSFHSKQQELVMDYDPDKIEKICSNLISNAIKFTPGGGNVKCEIGRRKAETEPTSHFRFPTSDLLVITVRDRGMGISEEQLPFVFNRFYSLPSSPPQSSQRGEVPEEGRFSRSSAANSLSLKGRGGATGIGLALAKELTELLGGAITVESELGKGSAFTVTLPITRQAAVADAQPWNPAKTGGGGTTREASITSTAPACAGMSLRSTSTASPPAHPPLLLIVEDNPDVRAYLKTLLEGRYKIRTAPDGGAGVEKALAIVPDLIISDVMMPKMDGFELCRILKNDRRTSHVPIILLTARADLDSRLAGLRQGADAYLAKPFSQQELDIQIRKVLKLRRTLQEKYSGWAFAPPVGNEQPEPEAQFLEQARQIIEENLDNPDFSIDKFYGALGVSRTQCFRKFKALTGRPPAEFIRRCRLERARALLADTTQNISQVAFQVGFKDPSHFARAFQKEFGASPSEFRSNRADHK